jgi:DNA-binding NarL/FixJ family response regulator
MSDQALSNQGESSRLSRSRHGRTIQVMVVDDHPSVRYGVRRLIAAQPDMVTIADSGTASDATCELARWADVAVVDYRLGARDGLWLAQQIKQHRSPASVLIYSAFADAALTAAAIVAGADGLLPKTALAEELCDAIRRLFHGRQSFPAIPNSLAALLRSRLQPRDQAIFTMLMHGIGPTDISARLGITRPDLEARRQEILRAIAPNAARAHIPGDIGSR